MFALDRLLLKYSVCLESIWEEKFQGNLNWHVSIYFGRFWCSALQSWCQMEAREPTLEKSECVSERVRERERERGLTLTTSRKYSLLFFSKTSTEKTKLNKASFQNWQMKKSTTAGLIHALDNIGWSCVGSTPDEPRFNSFLRPWKPVYSNKKFYQRMELMSQSSATGKTTKCGSKCLLYYNLTL